MCVKWNREFSDPQKGLDPVELAQMALNLPYAHATRAHGDDLVIKTAKSTLVLRDQLRLKAAAPIPGNRQLSSSASFSASTVFLL